MKKVLFATTALVMTAGVAAAEVAVSGDGRLGLRYESDTGYTGDNSWNVVNRVRVKFSLTGESPAGISFGANLRSDQAANAGDNNSATSGDIYVSGAYGKLTAGDIDGALEQAVGDLPEVGLSGLDYWNEFAYATSEELSYTADLDNDGIDETYGSDAGLLYEYSIGNANLYASFSDAFYGNTDAERDTQSWALGVGYDLGGYTFGIGYEKADYTVNPFIIEDSGVYSTVVGPLGFDADSESWGISGGTSISGITLKGVWLSTSSDNDELDFDQYGLGAGYEMSNGVAVSAFYRRNEFDNIDVDGHAFGIGAAYDLGGGATIKGGIVDASVDNGTQEYNNTLADFGLSFNF
ncbi:porin [Paracoccus sediminicola]|uniref:porin n=1 Tax=Paracoccus sediminicola TaxID=3017783 RepID=UPI0022F0830D|nr:porin [Paracoccus sediminicola]WBU56794.1 porin [Paracoccus sediminicola]